MKAIYVPADLEKMMVEIDLPTLKYPAINKALAAYQPATQWIERVTSPALHSLAQPDYNPETRSGGPRYPSVVMVVDEEGILNKLPVNERASVLYWSGGLIAGDAILVGEDEVDTGEGYAEVDFTGLPERVTVQSVIDKILELLATRPVEAQEL